MYKDHSALSLHAQVWPVTCLIRIFSFLSTVFVWDHKKADSDMEPADSSGGRFIGEVFIRLTEEPTANFAKPVIATALPIDFVFEELAS